jgi:aerobic carbon-monoxide dehydrogenase medium subunit
MKPAPFSYHAPTSIDEALGLLAEHGEEAKILAGGQSLVPMMNLRLAQPGVLIDINRLADLAYIRAGDDSIAIGALTRHHDVATDVSLSARQPLLAAAAALIGYPAIRYRGTIGGSVAHADPVSEMCCVATTLDAELVVASAHARRTIPAADFFRGYFTSALAADELLVELRFPAGEAGTGWDFQEFARKSGDFAVAAVAIEVRVAATTISHCRIAIAGAADRSIRAVRAETAVCGEPAGPGAVAACRREVEAVVAAEAPTRDATFKSHVAGTLAERAITTALRRAGQEHR